MRGHTLEEWRVRMNILLWVLQVLLALAFFAHGCLFLFPPAALVAQMNASLPRWFQLFLGVAEVLAAVGLTLPGVARVQPWLVSWAAAGVMIVMICATIFHVMRGEVTSAIVTIVLLATATFIAYMRWRIAPIQPRSAR
jgi:putative oxidoreductase